MVVTRDIEETKKKVFSLISTSFIQTMSNILDAYTMENKNLYTSREKRWRVLAYSNYSYLNRMVQTAFKTVY